MNFLTNITITPNSNKSDLYNSCNSIEVPFEDDNHHILIKSKYFNNNEINTLKKGHHFGILHLNISPLNKRIDGRSNLLSLMKSIFPVIGLSENKIGLNTPVNNKSLPSYVFCFDETKTTLGGISFFLNEKHSCTNRSDLNILLDRNIGSIFIKINLSKKRNFFCACIYKHPHMSIVDFDLICLTPLLEKSNQEDKLCFQIGDFNIVLMKMESKFDSS